VDQLVELAGDVGDMDELLRLADAGSSDAVDVLVELAGARTFEEPRGWRSWAAVMRPSCCANTSAEPGEPRPH
jgi:hypothetical protein